MQRKIFVVSDATGSTAEHVLQAALAQFEAGDVKVERRPQTRTVDRIRDVVDEAHESGGMLVHTLASTDLRREIYLRATERRGYLGGFLGGGFFEFYGFLWASPGG